MINVQIEITGDKETIAKLNLLDKSFNDWTPELRKTGDFLKDYYSVAVFETEGGILGSRWGALQALYELWKRKAFPGRGILVRTGKLKGGYKYDVTSTYMELYNTVAYAKFHQSGTKFMPQRMLVNITDSLKGKIIDIFKVGLATRIATAAKK
jgi:phage gpG-like protein